ncbi:MAG TPA: hypothetical protein VK706_00950 [Candidatus Sulfotelmatobacter sp.]|jgi:hypothetical protein|nr:hypothetical protein [Candidatus Sulfotelmatobacter sp.]
MFLRAWMKLGAGRFRNTAGVVAPTILALTLFAGAGSVLVGAQAAEKLPSVEEVLERYVTATGGRDALLRHTSMTLHGYGQAPAKNLRVEGVLYTKDGKMLQKSTLPGGKVELSGYDGETAWDLDAGGKVTIHEGDEIKTIARDADMYYHLHVMNYFRTMEVVDVKEFNGRPCYHLRGVNNWGRTNEQFYDKENGLLLGYAFNTAWRGGKGDATETFEDYKDFGGVLMPVKDTSRDGDDLSIFTITSVTYDNVGDAVFRLPEAVQKAKAAAKTAAKEKSGPSSR